MTDRGVRGLPAAVEGGRSRASVLYIEDSARNVRLVEHIRHAIDDLEIAPVPTGEHGIRLARRLRPSMLDRHRPDPRREEVRESTWPAITAGPRSPGSGPPVHQPVWLQSAGTSSVPSRFRPSGITGAETPIAAIAIRTGRAASGTPRRAARSPRARPLFDVAARSARAGGSAEAGARATAESDRVDVLTIQDARASSAATFSGR